MKASRSFQVFVKPAGSFCNLACRYCYYLDREALDRGPGAPRMSEGLLEEYIVRHIEACPDEVVRFSWHGGEPTVLGVPFFREAVALQKRHLPPGRMIANGLQTNGTLLDEEWARFLAEERFSVGLSLDGPAGVNDAFRLTPAGEPTFERVLRGYEVLRRHGVRPEILCVVSARNVGDPLGVYRFFTSLDAPFLTFLPLVEPDPSAASGAGARSVPAGAWGDFLCAVFDEWVGGDIGRLKVQIVEEAARTAFGQEHSLCLFRPVCGDVPVVESNGDVYSCDHFVDSGHRLGNIRDAPLAVLLDGRAQRDFGRRKLETLPRHCLDCEVLDMCAGECPKNRFILAPDGEPGLNYLCRGYRRFFNHCRPFVEAVAAEWRRSRDTGP